MRPRKLPPAAARRAVRQLDTARMQAHVPARPSRGWVHAIRTALGMTHAQLGRRLGVGRQSVASIEANEVAGTVRMASLERAADALGCDLRYVLVPRRPLADTLQEQARRKASQRLARVNATQALEASAVPDSSMAIEDLATDLVRERPGELWNE